MNNSLNVHYAHADVQILPSNKVLEAKHSAISSLLVCVIGRVFWPKRDIKSCDTIPLIIDKTDLLNFTDFKKCIEKIYVPE